MTLQEAIEILENFQGEDFVENWTDYLSAFQLSIEALKKIKAARAYSLDWVNDLLPGETKE